MISESMNGSNDTLQHHPVFYLDFVIFAVEDTLFKVPRCGFEGRPDTPFEVAASISGQACRGHSTEQEGLVDSKPIYLRQIKKVEFESLLRVMYPQLPRITPLASQILGKSLARTEWIHVLKLSTMWDFDDIRQMAIEKLSVGFGSNPIEKILLAKEYRVSRWLLEGYAKLVGQQAPLSTQTLDSLDLRTQVSLLSLRDRYPPTFYGDHHGQYIIDDEGPSPTIVLCPKCRSRNNRGGHDMPTILETTFAAELADMS